MAVKNIYYDVLPEEVIKYANQMDFPIFMFDKKGSYYEDIVTEIYDKNKENISNRENVVPCLNTIDEIVERKINLFKNIKE